MIRRLLELALAAAILAGCTRPESYEAFIRTGNAVEGVYSFDLDLSEEDCSYDISFFTRVDAPLFRQRSSESMPLAVIWTGPEGESFSETVFYPTEETMVPYRSGVVMDNPGVWNLRVNVISSPKGLRGLGIICKRNENGTRQTP